LLAAVTRNPTDAQARYDLGQYYFQHRIYDKAAEQLKLVTELRPKEVNPYHVLGDIYMALGDRQKALDTWKIPTIIAPNIPAAFNKYGIGLQLDNQHQQAVEQFKKAVELNPRFEEAYYHMGESYEALGRTQDAVMAYEQTALVAQDKNSFWVKRATQRVQALADKK
jgi:superkiller protein 3